MVAASTLLLALDRLVYPVLCCTVEVRVQGQLMGQAQAGLCQQAGQ